MLNKFLLVGVCLCAALCYGSASGTKTVFFPEEGYDLSMYEPLNKVIMTSFGGKLQDSEICFAHGKKGFVDGMAAYRSNPERCTAGLVLLGAAPGKSQDLQGLEAPLLVLAGDLDGILRFSSFAAAKHKFGSTKRRFAIIQGASHHSFASGDKPLALDLRPDIGHSKAHSTIAAVVNDFVFSSDKGDTMLKKNRSVGRQACRANHSRFEVGRLWGAWHRRLQFRFSYQPNLQLPEVPRLRLAPWTSPSPIPNALK